MRGEITIRKQEMFSLYSNTYINSILNLLGLHKTTEENFALAQSLLPTIIKSSVEKNDLNILRNMKNEISNISYQSYSKKSPLHISSKLGFYEVTEFLISCRLNINELDYNGYTALDYACEYKHKLVAVLIKENGGVLNKNVNNAKLFNQLAFVGDLDSLVILNNCGANILSNDFDGRNIGHIAASEGKTNILEYLLNELKLDIMIKDRWGNNPYSEGNKEVKELIEKKYKIGNILNLFF
jgi:ankyrin repeat protein